MRYRRARESFFALIACIFFLYASVIPAAERPLEEAKLAKLRATIGALREDLDRTRDAYDRTRREIRGAEERIAVLGRSLRQIGKKIDRQHRRIAQLKSRRAGLQTSLTHQRDQLATQVRAAYATGHQEYLRLLLNQENPAEVGRVLTYYDYFNRARSKRINGLQATLKELESLRAALSRETARLESMRSAQTEEKRTLERVRRERSVLLVRLKSEMSSKDRRLEGLLADARDLETVVAALRRAVDEEMPPASQPFKRLRGKLAWPTRGRLKARFGTPRVQGVLRWDGVLIRAGQGQEVRAVARGRVAFADWMRGYGLLLVIDHGDGYMSLYGHNQSLFKEAGEWVDGDDVIAIVGNSGGQEADALYFEIRHKGKPLDPAKWCRRS